MGKDVIFIQGGGEGAYTADEKLAISLRQQLGADYNVMYPQMPSESDPDYEVWKPRIYEAVAAADEEVILLGHSVGGYLLLKFLTEAEVPKKSIPGVCLIAVPFPDGDRNWHFEGFSLSNDFAEMLPRGAQVFLYHSPDDQIVPFAHMELYAKKIPKAIVRETTGGHQLNNDLSTVAKDIRRLDRVN